MAAEFHIHITHVLFVLTPDLMAKFKHPEFVHLLTTASDGKKQQQQWRQLVLHRDPYLFSQIIRYLKNSANFVLDDEKLAGPLAKEFEYYGVEVDSISLKTVKQLKNEVVQHKKLVSSLATLSICGLKYFVKKDKKRPRYLDHIKRIPTKKFVDEHRGTYGILRHLIKNDDMLQTVVDSICEFPQGH